MRNFMRRHAFLIVFIVCGGLAALMGVQHVQASAGAMFAARADVAVQLTLARGFYAIVHEVAQQPDKRWGVETGISTTSNLRYKSLPW